MIKPGLNQVAQEKVYINITTPSKANTTNITASRKTFADKLLQIQFHAVTVDLGTLSSHDIIADWK